MDLFSLIAVLVIEQIRPLSYRRVVFDPLLKFAHFLESLLNAGGRHHGFIAWGVGVGGVILFSGGIYFYLQSINPILAFLWNILILYLTMGFRQFSHYYTDIQLALRTGDVIHARKLLAEWRGKPSDGLSSSDISRLSIEEALAASHRHVFGVLVYFVLLPGPCGAVFYRAAAFFSEIWGGKDTDSDRFGSFSKRAFSLNDWLPLRVTAAGFAVVGDFEDAVYCWRTQADKWPLSNLGSQIGIVLSSGAGALGVRLGMPFVESGQLIMRPAIGTGDAADVDFMQSAVGLVWRALLLWLLLLLLIGIAGFVGF